jgi:hypothetical protein
VNFHDGQGSLDDNSVKTFLNWFVAINDLNIGDCDGCVEVGYSLSEVVQDGSCLGNRWTCAADFHERVLILNEQVSNLNRDSEWVSGSSDSKLIGFECLLFFLFYDASVLSLRCQAFC